MASVPQTYNLAQMLGIIGGSAAPAPQPDPIQVSKEPRPQRQPVAPRSSSGVMGTVPGSDPNQGTNDFINKLLNVKRAEKAAATEKLGQAMTLSQAGWPIHPDAFAKLVRKSGLKDIVETNPDKLQAMLSSQQDYPFGAQQGPPTLTRGGTQAPGTLAGNMQNPFGQQTALPRNPFQQNPDGTITAQPGLPEHVQEAVSLHNDSVTGKLDPKTAGQRSMSMHIKALAHSAWQAIKLNLLPDQEKAKLALDIEQKKRFILDNPDSPLAAKYAGALAAAGMVPWNFDKVRWDASSPEQKQQQIRFWNGYDPQHVEKARLDLANTLIGNGLNPADAMQYADDVMNNRPVPPELQAKYQPPLTRTLMQLEAAQVLPKLGLPAEHLGEAFDMLAKGATLQDVLTRFIPPGARTEFQQNLDVSLQGIQAEKGAKLAEMEQRFADYQLRLRNEGREEDANAVSAYERALTLVAAHPDDPNAKALLDQTMRRAAPAMNSTYEAETEHYGFLWLKTRQAAVGKLKPRADTGVTDSQKPPGSQPTSPAAPTASEPTGDSSSPIGLSGLGAITGAVGSVSKAAMPLIGLNP